MRLVTVAVAVVLALSACGGDGGSSGDAAATTSSAEQLARIEAMDGLIVDHAYPVAIALWKDERRFPTTDPELERLAKKVAARLPDAFGDAGELEKWSVVAYRGDYGGNKGLLACTPGVLTVRLVVPKNGRSIGFGVADGEVTGALVYDPDKIGQDEQFNDEGFFARSGACATDDTELAATEKASRSGRF